MNLYDNNCVLIVHNFMLTFLTSVCDGVPGTRGFSIGGRSYLNRGSMSEHSATERVLRDVSCLKRCC